MANPVLPVLIVGAGPVGMTLASELARYQVPLRIIDQAAQRTDKSKALVVWSRTLELFDRSASDGRGGAEPFIDAGIKAHAVNFVAGAKMIGHVTMDDVESPHNFALMLPQSETERLLEARLEELDIAVERQVELTGFTTRADGADVVLRHPDGREEQAAVDWLIGCDGAHSAVRHGLKAPFTGETMDSDWMLADIHMTGYPFPDTELSIYWHRDGIFVVFPISPGRYRVIADLPSNGEAHPTAPTLEQVQALIDRRGPADMIASDPVWLSGFRINGRKVSDYRYGRAFLLGDAAHVHSPAGGQGMNTGMQDAFNLAWKLALMVRGVVPGPAGEKLLDSFSPERSAVGEQVLKAADRLTEIGTLHNPVAQTLRNMAAHVALGLAPVQHAVMDRMTEVAIAYPDSPLNGRNGASGGPKPGERVTPLTGQSPIGAGTTPRFALFAEHNDAALDLTRRFSTILDPEIRPPFAKAGYWLARPDGYLACSSSNPEAIADYLDDVTGAA